MNWLAVYHVNLLVFNNEVSHQVHTICQKSGSRRIPRMFAEIDEANTVEVGETATFPAKCSSSLQGAPIRVENIGARLGDEDRDLTMAEKFVF